MRGGFTYSDEDFSSCGANGSCDRAERSRLVDLFETHGVVFVVGYLVSQERA